MKLAILLLGISTVYGLPTSEISKDSLKPFELDDVVGSSLFPYRTFNGKWISETKFVYRNPANNNLYVYDVAAESDDLKNDLKFDVEELSELKIIPNSYELSADEKLILIRYDVKTLFRHSSYSKFIIFDSETKEFEHVGGDDNEDLQKCVWSPTDRKLAFIKDNNVFIRDENGLEINITSDGISGVIYNGMPDWVYEEEVMHSDVAIWFSPDGNRLAIVHIDDSDVEDYIFHKYGTPGDINYQYPQPNKIRFPKTGGNLPKVKVLVKDLTNLNANNWITFTAPIDKVSDEHIIGPVRWYDDDHIVLTWFNRRQNESFTQMCSADDSTLCTDLFSISESNGWIDWWMVPVCSSDTKKCFYFKHHNGWFGIQEIDVANKDNNKVSMERPVTAIEIFGFANGDLYYSSTVDEHPEYKQVYKNDDCLTCEVVGPDNEKCTYSNAVFSKDFSYYAMICNGPSLPYSKLFKTEGNIELETWETNVDTREKLEEYEKINIKYDRIEVADGFSAIVKLYLPNEIDVSTTVEKYPMIVYIYGAPNHVRVLDTFSIGYQNYLVTKQKIIYCLIDGRGSGYKGTDMLFTINNRMGTIEIADNINVTKQLLNKYEFIDEERIGIWGWSYGGYATALTITEDTEKIFKGGISVAPAISFFYYDPIYSERYMGKPTVEDNLAGYQRGDVSLRADKFHNHNFFLIHGTADDNVHFQHAMLLSKALQQKNVYFEQLSYPDEDHGLGGVTKHLYKTMDEFWTRVLSIE